jgi:abequosyltransferase
MILPRLSLCMPTYNFGRFIGEAIESILPQLSDQVELVILDGGSTDDTPLVVAKYPSPHIRYIRQAHRGGIDRDMARTVDEARGEYVWLFSSDDVMRPDAIERILQALEEKADIYLLGFTMCGYSIQEEIGPFNMMKRGAPLRFALHNEKERHLYFSLAVQTAPFFSYMSSLVFKRERWLSIPLEEEFIGSCWAHAVRLLRLIPKGLTLRILPDSFLFRRSFNDSFMDKGLVHRIGIAVYGYQKLARHLFGEDSYESRQIRRVLVQEQTLRTFVVAKSRVSDQKELQKLNEIVESAYQDLSFLNLCKKFFYFSFSVSLSRQSVALYRQLKRWIGVRNLDPALNIVD